MKKSLSLLAIICGFSILSQAQEISILTDADTDPGIPCDTGRFRIAYSMNFLSDTTRTDAKPINELMILEVGKKVSLFYSYSHYVADSVFAVDIKNKVSNAVINEHLQQFDPGRISWILYKNYHGKGNTALLQRIGIGRYKCEEENQVPEWKLLPDTTRILGYKCLKATASYKGRNWMAWYAPDIPINEGPWKLCGLPGMILKAEEEKHTYTFEANGLKKMDSSHSILYKGNKYEPISRKNLDKLLVRYYADPVGFINNDPNVTVTFTDENGNKTANPKAIPYNPIEK